jgi:hypothetical protein
MNNLWMGCVRAGAGRFPPGVAARMPPGIHPLIGMAVSTDRRWAEKLWAGQKVGVR